MAKKTQQSSSERGLTEKLGRGDDFSVAVNIDLIDNGFIVRKSVIPNVYGEGFIQPEDKELYCADAKSVVNAVREFMTEKTQLSGDDVFDSAPRGLFIAIHRRFNLE